MDGEGLRPNTLTGSFASKKNWPSIIRAAISASQISFAASAVGVERAQFARMVAFTTKLTNFGDRT